MAAGLVTLNILDGDGNTKTARFMSSTGLTTGLLSPVSVPINSDETLPVIDLGSLTETAPATDTASSGVNGRLQRIAQRITSFIALIPPALGRQAAASSLGAALSTEDKAALDLVATDLGATNEAAPASDTASSGLNGRLQRIAQRLSSLITALGSPFQAGGALGAGSAIIGKVSNVDSGGTDITNTTAHSLKTTLYDASGTAIDFTATSPVTQSGTWTVQPGNTANTTAWKVDGSAVTQPVSPPTTVAGSPLHADVVSGAITTAMTSTTTTSLVAAPGASLRNYITTIIVSNAHATVGTDVIIQDGSGGTTLLTIPAAAVYGGAVITLPTPLRQPTTNTALYCANVTTGASTKVSAVGYKAA